MSNGEEDEKGTAFTKETFACSSETPGIDFLGNVEGHDLFETKLDVFLCDGFTGNVVLKSCRGHRQGVSPSGSRSNSTAARCACSAPPCRAAPSPRQGEANYESYGGWPLLGVNGVVVIAHGSSSALAIRNAIRVACESVSHGSIPTSRKALAETRLAQWRGAGSCVVEHRRRGRAPPPHIRARQPAPRVSTLPPMSEPMPRPRSP